MRFQHIEWLINRLRMDSEPAVAKAWSKPSKDAVERIDSEAFVTAKVLEGYGHFDAGESAILSRQLLFVKQREANVLYPNLKCRQFIPVSNEIPSGATSFSIKVWDIAGLAKIVANYATDFPSVNTFVSEVLAAIRSVGDSYEYTLQDLRSAAMAGGLALDQRRAAAARMIHERKIESIAALGDTANGLGGALKNSNVGLTTITGSWASATSAAILADLHAIPQGVVTQSKGVHAPDTMLLGTVGFGIVSVKAYSDYSPDTILQVFLRNSPYIKNVDQWVQCDLADAGSDGPRIFCYQRDPMVLTLEIPQEFEQLPPQLQGLSYKVPCHSRIGGVSVSYPLACTYADGSTA